MCFHPKKGGYPDELSQLRVRYSQGRQVLSQLRHAPAPSGGFIIHLNAGHADPRAP